MPEALGAGTCHVPHSERPASEPWSKHVQPSATKNRKQAPTLCWPTRAGRKLHPPTRRPSRHYHGKGVGGVCSGGAGSGRACRGYGAVSWVHALPAPAHPPPPCPPGFPGQKLSGMPMGITQHWASRDCPQQQGRGRAEAQGGQQWRGREGVGRRAAPPP